MIKPWLILSIYLALLTSCWSGLPVWAQTSQERGPLTPSSRWSSSLSWSASRNLDYYSDYFTSLSSDLRYHINDGLAMGLGFGYSQPVEDDEEQVRRYGFDDVSVGVIFPQLMKHPGSSLSGSVNAVLPTSRSSQKASLVTSIEAGLNYFVRWKTFGLSTAHTAIFSHYEYDTADEQGEVQNSPYGLNNSLTGTVFVSQNFNLAAGGGIYIYQTYSGKNKQVLSSRVSAGFQVSQQLSLQAAYSWRDSLITNNSFLDDDTTTASLSMSYTF